MNCFDCHALGQTATAVAICHRCGAALCGDHARTTPHVLHRFNGMGVATMPRSARRIVCSTCIAAEVRA
ncbi:hypothetical protein VT50_0221260 [Streptomyces antioxidans]|uniref:DUF2180 family protein n=1 Tax=Streptomyces antioxidans TaxID=1507734 RepID=A0A1V4D262_9ACTN|nr:DUF2180 family protein [Streptomyces antioxidans]OPF77311.1 hypothetical protein VT50_0221260 [Streptomyces antioxidans]